MKNIFIFCFALLGFLSSHAQNIKTDSTAFYDKIFFAPQQEPVFPGNITEWLSGHTNYPKRATDNNIQGTVYLNFIIEKDGSVSSIKILKGVQGGSCLDSEAFRVVSTMPKWNPGIQNGHTVKVQYSLPIQFKLKDMNTKETPVSYSKVEVKPKFPGDMDKWIKDNVVYPDVAIEKYEQGTVYVSFVIEKDGAVDDINILRYVEPLLDQEAVKVISSMPKWTPGQQGGHDVRVQKIVPVNFAMPEDSTMPLFPYDLVTWIREQMDYPQEALAQRLEGIVTVTFIVRPDGSNYSSVKRDRIGYEPLYQEATQIMLNMPQWRPIHRHGYTYPHTLALKIPFSIYNDSIMHSIPVFSDSIVQQKPKFAKDINEWLLRRSRCPWSARRQSIEGDVTVGFIIEEDGSVSHVTILKNAPDGWMLDDEAKKYVTGMVGWTPGFIDELPVRTRTRLTFHFKSDKKTDE